MVSAELLTAQIGQHGQRLLSAHDEPIRPSFFLPATTAHPGAGKTRRRVLTRLAIPDQRRGEGVT